MENLDNLSSAVREFAKQATPEEKIAFLDYLGSMAADVLAAFPAVRQEFDHMRAGFLAKAAA